MKVSITVLSLLFAVEVASVPTAIFHGLGDACRHRGMKKFTEKIADDTGDIAKCVEVGSGMMTSIFENFQVQAEAACSAVLADPDFQGEFNVLGLSQGGLLARYVAQQCPTKVPVRNLATLGGPNRGVAAIPNCGEGGIFCDMIDFIVDNMVYYDLIQDLVGPAGYYRDPKDLERYLKHCVFLPYHNNEKEFDVSIVDRMTALHGALFVMFDADSVVYPRESEWFHELQEDGSVKKMEETELYLQDMIGLKTLVEDGRAQFVAFPGEHLQITNQQIEEIVAPFLAS
eukprot:CAMPEP_0202956728 /NCGR_PEP_ID=MMETSP1396-20130829/1229_1 /ASSEMBLY_ACC=CAM_ASM_000872 /TAXON_ID= /ORGANISM="Pseudokeronopsis sp., Strain Brazil" /LENGTH=285 /DNA_ID=CAMNT_0049673891 /DNA_START=17 /DNA_END=874 /DNA_ORIENTATION=-